MSSSPNSASQSEAEEAAESIGLSSGLRLGLIYAVFFTLVLAAVYAAAYFAVVPNIERSEMDVVRNRVAEYRAWYESGEWDMVVARMKEQSLQSGDLMFARIHTHAYDLRNVISEDEAQAVSVLAELADLDPVAKGAGLELDSDRWAVVSLEMENGAVLQAGKNMRMTDQILARLRFIGIVIVLLALVTATIGGTLVTYSAMAPIRRLIVAMQGINRRGELGDRVEPESGRNELNALVQVYNRLLARNEKLIESMHNALDNVAHDFRTPLSRLRITAEQALAKGGDADEMREALADSVEESEQLGRLLTTLMDVAEAESGAMRLELEEISLPDLVESVVELYELVAEEKNIGVSLDLPEECRLKVDRTRLGQAVANLLDNAIKYSSEGGKVEVSLKADTDRVTIAVQDEGIGIAENDLPHVWERLYRAEPSRTTPGTGLGLSFVRAIIEAHGGEVSVKSAPGKGAAFEVTLPATASSSGE